MHMKHHPLAEDLDHILGKTENLWEEFRGKRLFITGGTGFFGCWLLESFAWANNKLDLNMSALVLTRNYEAFQKSAPHLAANPSIQFHIGDVRNFDFPESEFSFVIHAAATSARATFNHEDDLIKFDTIVEGTRHTLDFAVQCQARKFLLTSSGAVYGKQPFDMIHISEDYCGAPDPVDPGSAWGEGKRVAEFLCAYYSRKHGIETKVARCFSFVGPYLPLDIHYAVGNFIRDGLHGGPICISGDGTPFRSYLYAADLVVWLWTILFHGVPGEAYNVGSEDAITISDLAYEVSAAFSHMPEVVFADSSTSSRPGQRYVPSVQKAVESLELNSSIKLNEALRKTIRWNEMINMGKDGQWCYI